MKFLVLYGSSPKDLLALYFGCVPVKFRVFVNRLVSYYNSNSCYHFEILRTPRMAGNSCLRRPYPNRRLKRDDNTAVSSYPNGYQYFCVVLRYTSDKLCATQHAVARSPSVSKQICTGIKPQKPFGSLLYICFYLVALIYIKCSLADQFGR